MDNVDVSIKNSGQCICLLQVLSGLQSVTRAPFVQAVSIGLTAGDAANLVLAVIDLAAGHNTLLADL